MKNRKNIGKRSEPSGGPSTTERPDTRAIKKNRQYKGLTQTDLNITTEAKFRKRLKTWSCLRTLSQMFEMCLVNLSSLSTFIPSRSTLSYSSITISFATKQNSLLVPQLRPFSLNQLTATVNSY